MGYFKVSGFHWTKKINVAQEDERRTGRRKKRGWDVRRQVVVCESNRLRSKKHTEMRKRKGDGKSLKQQGEKSNRYFLFDCLYWKKVTNHSPSTHPPICHTSTLFLLPEINDANCPYCHRPSPSLNDISIYCPGNSVAHLFFFLLFLIHHHLSHLHPFHPHPPLLLVWLNPDTSPPSPYTIPFYSFDTFIST